MFDNKTSVSYRFDGLAIIESSMLRTLIVRDTVFVIGWRVPRKQYRNKQLKKIKNLINFMHIAKWTYYSIT